MSSAVTQRASNTFRTADTDTAVALDNSSPPPHLCVEHLEITLILPIYTT